MECCKEHARGEERWQVIAPSSLRDSVLRASHGTAGAGHFGVAKTLHRLRQGFYWGRVRRDVEDFCRGCDLCAAYKGPKISPLHNYNNRRWGLPRKE